MDIGLIIIVSFPSLGLLCITCTDMAVLAGVHPDKCYSLYQGIPLHTEYGQEMAIRLVLSSLETSANKYAKYIEPLLSSRIDFYVRIFVRVHKSPLQVKMSINKKSYVYGCSACKSYFVHPLGFMNYKSEKLKFSHSTISSMIGTNCQICDGSLQVSLFIAF